MGPSSGPPAPLLRLDGFEGPLDLLLELARTQKVDLARISILLLVEQYLAVVEAERQLRLELAADWLVMAAWLAWLKSRLLLPQEAAPGEEGEIAAELLATRLAALAHVRRGAAWFGARDQLGHEVFARGACESLVEVDRSGLRLDMPQLLAAYLSAMRRAVKRRVYRPRPPVFWSVQDALSRLRLLLGDGMRDWCGLDAFLPDWLGDAGGVLARRAALAAALLAGLELARSGEIELDQMEAFGPIALRGGLDQRTAMREAAE